MHEDEEGVTNTFLLRDKPHCSDLWQHFAVLQNKSLVYLVNCHRNSLGDAIARAGKALRKKGDDIVEDVLAASKKNPCNKASFAPETLVLMSDQSFRKIASLRIGDRVASRNEFTGRYGSNLITALPGSFHEDRVIMQLDDGSGKLETVVTTLEHPFYIEGHGFVDAGDMKTGMKVSQWQARAPPSSNSLFSLRSSALLVQNVSYREADDTGSLLSRWLSQAGKWLGFKAIPVQAASRHVLLVKSIKIILSGLKPWRAYNLTVANDHTYFVGNQKAWVHNCKIKEKTRLDNGKEIEVELSEARLDHVLKGDTNGRGGHSTNSGSVKTVGNVEVGHGGVRRAQVEINGVTKTNNGGFSTLFPASWSDKKVLYEFTQGLKTGATSSVNGKPRVVTPSGVTIEYVRSGANIKSFYPVFE